MSNRPIVQLLGSIELLSPARNLECGIEAIRHGADAVYIGAPRFGARAAAGNSVEDIAELVRFAHPFGVKIYVTVNTLLYDEELAAVDTLIGELQAAGVDALIVQDERLMTLNRGRLPLHSSTQMDNRTIDDVRARLEAGYEQTVLARELSLDDIRAIHAAVPEMPLEAFVHGALCVSYSGRCYASEYCFGRSANRGECAQFCRLPFDLIDADGRIITAPEGSPAGNSASSPTALPKGSPLRQRHLLSLKDMNRSTDLEAMMDAGIRSFKIEGRLKDVSYVKNITAYYRQRIDAILARRPQDYCRASIGISTVSFTPNPLKSFNRGFTDYFLHGRTRDMANFATPKSMGEAVGYAKSLSISPRGGKNRLSSHNLDLKCFELLPPTGGAERGAIHNGDGLCFFDAEGQLHGFRVNRVDEQGRIHPADPSVLKLLRPGTSLYRNLDADFERQLSKPTAERRIPVSWLLEDHETGFRLTLTIKETGTSVSSTTYVQELEAAHTPQADNIRRQLMRLGDTPYTCTAEDIEIRFSDNWFIPASVMGEWRREMVNRINESLPSRGSEVNSGMTECQSAQSDRGISLMQRTANSEGSIGGESPLMTCRFCLRHALGYCTREAKSSPPRGEIERGFPYREPLSLRLSDGRTFPLRFDCKACEMQVLAGERGKAPLPAPPVGGRALQARVKDLGCKVKG